MSDIEILFGIFGFMILLLILVLALVVRGKRNSHDGFLDISEQDSSQIHQLEITTPPDQLKDQEFVVFKVRKIPSS